LWYDFPLRLFLETDLRIVRLFFTAEKFQMFPLVQEKCVLCRADPVFVVDCTNNCTYWSARLLWHFPLCWYACMDLCCITCRRYCSNKRRVC